MLTPAKSEPTDGIPSTAYTHEYYVDCCQGHQEFKSSHGQSLPLRLQIPLDFFPITHGMKVLDLGCGRGELAVHAARRGASVWGMDYAEAALDLAQALLQSPTQKDVSQQIRLVRGSVLDLPFADQQFDLVFMLDVVEHLHPHELEKTLQAVHHVLRRGGHLIVHTMPNLWYYRWGYPLYRAVQRLRGQVLPADPRSRWSYSDVHVNEQTPVTLAQTLQACDFASRVWLQNTQVYPHEASALVRMGMHFLTRAWPFRWIFCNDIFAIGTKR